MVTDYGFLGCGLGMTGNLVCHRGSSTVADPSPDGSTIWTARTAAELDLAGQYQLTVVAIERGREVIPLPSSDERLRWGDAVVVMGPDEQVDRFLNRRA